MNAHIAPRRLLVTASLFAAVAISYVVAAVPESPAVDTSSVVRTQRIELVDERGNQRARLSVEPGGEVVLRLLSASGEIRVKLGASNDGSGLILMNGATEPAVHMIAEVGKAQVKVKDGSGEEILDP